MKCPYCGQPLKDDARFCGSCGADLTKEAPTPGRTLRDAVDERREPAPAARTQPAPRVPEPAPQAPYRHAPQGHPQGQAVRPTYTAPVTGQPSYATPRPQDQAQQTQVRPQPTPAPRQEQTRTQGPQQGRSQGQGPQQGRPQGQGPQQGRPAAPRRGLPKRVKIGLVVAGALVLAGVVFGIVRAAGILGGGGGGGTGTGGAGTGTGTGGITLGQGGQGGQEGGQGTTSAPFSPELVDTYEDDSFGYRFRAPAGASQQSSTDAGKISLHWQAPDLWVNAYVGTGGSVSPTEVGAYLVENYDATVVETGEDYVVTVCADSDGDTNYTMVYVTESNLQYLDIYYHPADEDTMHDVAFAIMESFEPGKGVSGGAVVGGGDVPVEIDTSIFSPVAAGTVIVDETYGFSATVVGEGFSQMETGGGAIFLVHEDPQLFVSCFQQEGGFDTLKHAYNTFVNMTGSGVECSEATYDEDAGYFVYTETDAASGKVSLYKVYVGDRSTQVFVANYDLGDEAAEALAREMADTFQRGA